MQCGVILVTGYALGGPTLEMFVNSWNKSFTAQSSTLSIRLSEETNTYDDYSWTGYQIRLGNGSWDSYITLSGVSGDKSLYFPVDSENDDIIYWIATETDDENIRNSLYAGDGCINTGDMCDASWETLRPVVCIPTSLVY